MPLVILKYRTYRGLNQIVKNLADELPMIVASNLSTGIVHEGHVEPADIIVEPVPASDLSVNEKDIEIYIISHDYPARRVNLEERNRRMFEKVLSFLADYDRNVSGFVWTLLMPTAFKSFEIEIAG